MKPLYLLIFLTITLPLSAQQKVVTGLVTDSNNMPLEGVNVLVKGSTHGNATDKQGIFSFKAETDETLLFSMVGYLTEEVTVSDKNIFTVKLQTEDEPSGSVLMMGCGSPASKVVLGEPQETDFTQEFENVKDNPIAHFSIDVDDTANTTVKKILKKGNSIPEDGVKIEQMLNSFSYEYEEPTGDTPLSINTEVIETPWNTGTKLVKIGLHEKKSAQHLLKDAKVELLFNPKTVKAYRRVGYENKSEKQDDAVVAADDAVTVLYELIPVDQETEKGAPLNKSNELLTLSVSYINNAKEKPAVLKRQVLSASDEITKASGDLNFMSAIAMFGLHLQKSPLVKTTTLADVLQLASTGKKYDPNGDRAKFIMLVKASEVY